MPEGIGALTGQNQIEGTVSAVLFCNEENGYTVLRLDCAEKGEVTAVGCMPGVAPGEALELEGSWGRHPAYGEQLQGEVVTRRMPVGEKAVYRTLLLEVFRERGVPLLETLPQGVEVTTRSGEGGTYQFFFNNTVHGQNFQLQGERVHLRPLEMKIRTEKEVWV